MSTIKLSDRNKSSKSWTAKDALKHMLDKVETTDKILVLRLNTDDGDYNINSVQAGMTTSELIALIEVAKTTFLQDMGYIL